MLKIFETFLFLFVLASNAMAELSMDTSTGIVTGDLDKAPFMAIACIIVISLGIFWGVKRALGLLDDKKSKYKPYRRYRYYYKKKK
ncbi:Uncharacterised protein [Campylobacter sputorum subsp. bubulus]|uniref:hypothetical protein n=1 Tax=Campylobacter sputorum TaxID=206 RepID=UPI000B7864FA|nr:hypothetical protein [Campylobacter sputorum]ASM37192.1 hypothetical protein CSF_1341 [Campylobacter sputorum bv. faecalis CCUG 20703]SUX08346.1 Uncharacterised protein [Campylobacter sputorum subsp. bubulus]